MGLIYRESLATCTRALHGEAVRQEMRTTLPNVFGKDDPDWNLAQQLLHTTLVHEGVHEAEHLPGKRERRGEERSTARITMRNAWAKGEEKGRDDERERESLHTSMSPFFRCRVRRAAK